MWGGGVPLHARLLPLLLLLLRVARLSARIT
jgi:hypothetical protein